VRRRTAYVVALLTVYAVGCTGVHAPADAGAPCWPADDERCAWFAEQAGRYVDEHGAPIDCGVACPAAFTEACVAEILLANNCEALEDAAQCDCEAP